MHPFEACGLGKAPYRYLGTEKRVFQACQGAPIQPGSTCDYCGQAIMYLCWVSSADGKRFKVGCDCVEKVALPNIAAKAKRSINEGKKADRLAADKARWQALSDRLAADATFLADAPSPTGRGDLRSYVKWCLQHAGQAGRNKCVKLAALRA